MSAYFAPNNNKSSKLLFTGRGNDLEEIINLILAGNCIALYGERRSGKTLTLEMLSMIIDGQINSVIDSLVDQDLRAQIPIWQAKLSRFKSIYTSLQAIRTEAELVESIVDCVKSFGILSKPRVSTTDAPATGRQQSLRLRELLDAIQTDCISKSYRLVVLVDEMEILEEFEQRGSTVAELFCDRKRYSEILFVHTGSHIWNQRVSSPGSLFTHLEPHYLKSIQVDALRRYLLSPLAPTMRDFVVQLSGAKPLYVQYIGKYIIDNCRTNPGNKLREDLLGNISLCAQIEQNIFHESRLEDNAKRILALLAHHPNVGRSWIAEKLKLSEIETGNILTSLSRFGTLSEEKAKYEIVGTIIEEHGRKISDDPAGDNYKQPPAPPIKKLRPVLLWVSMIGLLAISWLFYNYYNPPTRLEQAVYSNLTITLDVPESLETNQEGEYKIIVASATDLKNIVLVFASPQIRYDLGGESAVRIDRITNGLPINRQIKFYVLPGESQALSTSVAVQGNQPHEFTIARRPVSLQRYSLWISAILGLIAALIPGKEWGAVITFGRQLIGTKQKSS